jgi:hypothetical protein
MVTYSPFFAVLPNKDNMPVQPLETKYKMIYFQELKKLEDGMRERVLALVGNDSLKDKEALEFIKNVTVLAETAYEKECETQALILKNKNKPKCDAPPRQ